MAVQSNTSLRVFSSRFTSVISISLVLLLLGLVALLGFVARDLSVFVKENISFSIVLSDKMSESDILLLQKKLNAASYVKSTEYISKEQAVAELTKEIGEDPSEFLGFNPLMASLEVRLNADYANNDSIAVIEQQIKKESNIQDIMYRKDLIQAVNENVRKIGFILVLLAAVLMVISFALISNTIRLVIYSKRFLIRTMQLVGASSSFIRKPIVLQNMGSGLIGAFLAMALLSGLMYYLSFEIEHFFLLISTDTLLMVFLVMAVLGIVITYISAFFSVNKYLKMESGHLYHI